MTQTTNLESKNKRIYSIIAAICFFIFGVWMFAIQMIDIASFSYDNSYDDSYDYGWYDDLSVSDDSDSYVYLAEHHDGDWEDENEAYPFNFGNFTGWFLGICAIFIGITLIIEKKGLMAAITFGSFSLASLFKMVLYFVIYGEDPEWYWQIMASGVFGMIACILLFVIALFANLPALQKSAGSGIRTLWFLPAVIAFASALFGNIPHTFRHFESTWQSLVLDIILITGILFAGLWMGKKYVPKRPSVPSVASSSQSGGSPSPYDSPGLPKEAYYSLVKHVLLLVFTLGIWELIWVYKVTGYLNCILDEPPRNPTTKLLLYIFVPFYSLYWIYKSAQRIDKIAKTSIISSNLAALCLIVAIFIGIIPLILMQDKINEIVTKA